MNLLCQIALGTSLLVICALLHVGIVASSIPFIQRLARTIATAREPLRLAMLLSCGVIALVIAHTLQIWIWALAFLASNALPDFPTTFYFATVTYTTLGYGDITLGEGLRVFATFASIAGLLTFGFSTAFLIGLIVRLFPDAFGE